MTTNTIQYLKLREDSRHNQATESIEKSKLSETIANNLRNYGINLSKVQVEKLANDQLNDREVKKLYETVRSNMTKELETNRHNLSEEALQEMKTKLEALKPTGRSIDALIASYMLNNHMMSSLGYSSPIVNNFKSLADWISYDGPTSTGTVVENSSGFRTTRGQGYAAPAWDRGKSPRAAMHSGRMDRRAAARQFEEDEEAEEVQIGGRTYHRNSPVMQKLIKGGLKDAQISANQQATKVPRAGTVQSSPSDQGGPGASGSQSPGYRDSSRVIDTRTRDIGPGIS